MCFGTEAKLSGWENWPLPQTENDEMPDISLYGRDAIFLAKKFVQLAGPSQRGPRPLPGAAQASQLRSLEERIAVCKTCSMF